MNVGFIGLGIMGKPMAQNLKNAGYRLFLHNRSGVPDILRSGDAVISDSPRQVAEGADIIIMMLPDTPDVEEVLFGSEGISAALKPGKLVIDMSSISPLSTKSFAARVEKQSCAYLDAPVSGGEVGAKEAKLTIMIGGPKEAVARAMPLFQTMGKSITHIGDNGAGQTAKVANQIVVALTIEAVSEALVLASRAGADPAKVRQALLGGFAGSKILEVHGERMIKRTFNPGFRIKLHQKDLRLALSTADSLGLSLPNTALCQQLFNLCSSHGLAEADHSALIRAIETMSGQEA